MWKLLLPLALFFPQSHEPPRNLQLFLLIGQSNMAGRGKIEPQDQQALPRIFMLTKDLTWVPAKDPVHYDKPQIAGVGLARTFAKTLAIANPSADIGLIPAAFGGTSLDQWKPGGDLYKDAVRRTKSAMNSGTLRGILWHQGEADSDKESNAATYTARFKTMIEALRRDLDDPNCPVLIGELGEFLYAGDKNKFAATLNDHLATLPLHIPNAAFVSSARLTANPDNLHFDATSQREFGRRYALAYLSLDAKW